MQLKCLLKTVDFIPLVKSPRFWISPETVHFGSSIHVSSEIGHQLLSTYPGAFTVTNYDETTKKRSKQIVAADLTQGSAQEFARSKGSL